MAKVAKEAKAYTVADWIYGLILQKFIYGVVGGTDTDYNKYIVNSEDTDKNLTTYNLTNESNYSSVNNYLPYSNTSSVSLKTSSQAINLRQKYPQPKTETVKQITYKSEHYFYLALTFN